MTPTIKLIQEIYEIMDKLDIPRQNRRLNLPLHIQRRIDSELRYDTNNVVGYCGGTNITGFELPSFI